jgi:hypothetical protein
VAIKDFSWRQGILDDICHLIDSEIDNFSHPGGINDYYFTIGEAFSCKLNKVFRSREGLLDYLKIESVEEIPFYEKDLISKGLNLIDQGYRVGLVEIDHDGEGGGFTQDWIAKNQDKVLIHTDEIVIEN